MNKIIKILSIVVVIVCSLIGLIYYNLTHIDFIGTKSPEYLEHVQKRINFSTTKCDNTLQWETLTNRINDFFDRNNEYDVPDSIDVGVPKYIGTGWAGFEKAIYFDSTPKEIYLVSFNSSSYNHIDFIYSIDDDELNKIKTDTLSINEKNRIKLRLKSEILTRIDWDIADIQF